MCAGRVYLAKATAAEAESAASLLVEDLYAIDEGVPTGGSQDCVCMSLGDFVLRI